MGKTVGLIGATSGKVGNVVYFVRNGQQLMRVYVPKPANPKSTAQSVQRLKFALAGKLSSVVPREALEGFGGSRTERRGKFIREVVHGATVLNGIASVRDEDIVFSEGTLATNMLHSLTPVSGASRIYKGVTIQTTWPDSVPDMEGGYEERYVVLFLNNTTSVFDYGLTGVLNVPTTAGGSRETQVTLRVGDGSVAYTAIVYVYPFMRVTGSVGGGMRVSSLGTGDGTVVVDELTGEVLPSGFVYGRSLCVGRVVIPAPVAATVSAKGVKK